MLDILQIMCFTKCSKCLEVIFMVKNICEKCREEIQDLDNMVACYKCGKNYHRECWESVPNCVVCQGFNKDYAKAKIGKAVETKNKEISVNSEKEPPTSNTIKTESQPSPLNLYNSSTFHYNIGGKLKSGATLITIFGIIIGIIVAVILTMIDDELLFAGFIIGVVIAILGWLSSVLLYAYGELVSSAEKTANVLIKIYEEIKKD